MNKQRVKKQILIGTRKGGKTYSFNENHDHGEPAQWWFQQTQEGLALFIVFYTQACRWSQCLGCNLPSLSSKFSVNWKSLMDQIHYVFELPEVVAKSRRIKKLIVSNNGSVLDQETFSTTALMYLIAKTNWNLTSLKVITIETRPEYVDLTEIDILSRSLKEGDSPTDLELAVGFEAFDKKIRNDFFKKGLSLKVFEKFVAMVAWYNNDRRHKFRLKCYFMQKPVPGITDEDGVRDIKNAIDYLDKISRKYKVHVNMHLNPTYVAHGTALAKSFSEGKYVPPKLADVARAALHARGKKVSVFIGLFDEGLAVPGGSFIRRGDGPIIKKIKKFNRTGKFKYLK